MFQTIYDGWLHHPVLLWIPQGLFVAWLFYNNKWNSVSKLALIFSVVSFLDAWLTANYIFGIGTLSGSLGAVTPIIFVILGDLRYFISPDVKTIAKVKYWVRALLWAIVVPILVFIIRDRWHFESIRTVFLIYELSFLILVLLFNYAYWDTLKSNVPFRRLSIFVFIYYLLWASADVIILSTGSDLGYGLRLVPNFMYYGLWAPVFYLNMAGHWRISKRK